MRTIHQKPFGSSLIALLSNQGFLSAMCKTEVVSFLPITRASAITATSLLKLMGSENLKSFGFNPSISTPDLGLQIKPNLLTILLFPAMLFLTGVDVLKAWPRSIPGEK